MRKINLIIAIAIVLICVQFSIKSKYAESEIEQVVITHLNNAIRLKTTVCIFFNLPIIQEVSNNGKKTYIEEFKSEVPTLDKKFVQIKIRAFWEISDLVKFNKNNRNYIYAKNQVWNFAEEACRRIIITKKLEELPLNPDMPFYTDMRCNPEIESKIIQLANRNLIKIGIKINKIESGITYPIKDNL